MKRFFTFFVVLSVTCALWAGNVITYTATAELPEASPSDLFSEGFHPNTFNVSISSHTFSNGIGTITFSGEVTSIGMLAFYYCSGLTSVSIPNSVKSIGVYAFSGCSGLTSVTIPDSVTSIEGAAFEYCSGLTSITIPNSVLSIREAAFYGCSGLTSVTIPNSVTSIGEEAFSGCTSLTSVHISDVAAWCGILFGSRDANPFYYASHLYLNGEEIKDLIIPNSVTSIGDYAFRGCSDLTSVTIPNSVTSIGGWAFSKCSGLTSVTIGNSVTSMGEYAFAACTNLDDLYSYAIVPPITYELAFEDVSQHTPIHVPAGTARAYQKSVGWSKFLHFYEISELPEGTPTEEVGVTVTGNYATFTWPVNPTASSYTLTITKNGEVFCTLTFNSLGQLVGMAFAPGRNSAARAAEQTAYGYAFVVSGLEEGSTYHFTFASLDSQNNVLTEETGSFFIEDLTTGYSSVSGDTKMTTKFLRDGQLLIQRAGTTYNLRGQQIK